MTDFPGESGEAFKIKLDKDWIQNMEFKQYSITFPADMELPKEWEAEIHEDGSQTIYLTAEGEEAIRQMEEMLLGFVHTPSDNW